MTKIIVFIVGIAAAVMFYCMIALTVRQVKALLEGNHKEFMRLTTPYDVAELMAMKDFGTTSQEFEQAWKEVCHVLEGLATPYDAYLLCEQKMLAEDVTTEEDNL